MTLGIRRGTTSLGCIKPPPRPTKPAIWLREHPNRTKLPVPLSFFCQSLILLLSSGPVACSLSLTAPQALPVFARALLPMLHCWEGRALTAPFVTPAGRNPPKGLRTGWTFLPLGMIMIERINSIIFQKSLSPSDPIFLAHFPRPHSGPQADPDDRPEAPPPHPRNAAAMCVTGGAPGSLRLPPRSGPGLFLTSPRPSFQ